MKLLLNENTATDTLHVTTEIDDDGDIVIKYDGLNVMLIDDANGEFLTYYFDDDDKARLEAKGVKFKGHYISVN